MRDDKLFLTDKAFQDELNRCESCLENPCSQGCPAGCSPKEFIQAAKGMRDSDFLRSAALILKHNPLGGICGKVCSAKFCVAQCSRNKTNNPILIPDIQAHIVEKGYQLGVHKAFCVSNKQKGSIAIVGAGPAGLSAAAFLAQAGYFVTIFEARDQAGGMVRLIPEERLNRDTIDSDIDFIRSLGVEIELEVSVSNPRTLLDSFIGVVVANGRWNGLSGDIEGEEYAIQALDFLQPKSLGYKRAVVIGGGGVAIDCVENALNHGAQRVDMFVLETLGEMPITGGEREVLYDRRVNLHLRSRVKKIKKEKDDLSITVQQVSLPVGSDFSLRSLETINDSSYYLNGYDVVVLAIGTWSPKKENEGNLVYAGECLLGAASTVVESVASGKAAAQHLMDVLEGSQQIKNYSMGLGRVSIDGHISMPVDLHTKIFDYDVDSPFILSASPVTDGYERVMEAYRRGWSGCVLKTAFDGIQVKTPGEYMFSPGHLSYTNCDSVSERPLDEICRDIERLRKEFPEKLTMASTGTEMTGNMEIDRRHWVNSTKRLEDAGAMGIEFSMSCPGADGSEALALNQDLEKTLMVARWILSSCDSRIPKLFKLTASVPQIGEFASKIANLSQEFPSSKFGLTVGDTLPNLIFQNRVKKQWEDGVTMGAGGNGMCAITSFAIAKALHKGVQVNASGGIISYIDAANYLAMGSQFVQLCSMVMRYGAGVINELKSGLSWLMECRGICSVNELIGIAAPDIIRSFDSLSTQKKIPVVDRETCASCGNCMSCPSQAVLLDKEGYPVFDEERCVGCSLCNYICFTGALSMVNRS